VNKYSNEVVKFNISVTVIPEMEEEDNATLVERNQLFELLWASL
jgi:hypothetical protein